MKHVENLNSCVMLAANLISPVSFTSVFDSEDLKDAGVVFDSHITLIYAKDTELGRDEVLNGCNKIVLKSGVLGNGMDLTGFLKNQLDVEPKPVFSLFDIGNFENDSGYIVLKLKKDTGLFKLLETINYGLMTNFKIKSDFPDFNPHITLAELEPGMTEKYLGLKTLRNILNYSLVSFEDLILSYGKTGESGFDVYNLTTFKAAPRFFRIRELERESREL